MTSGFSLKAGDRLYRVRFGAGRDGVSVLRVPEGQPVSGEPLVPLDFSADACVIDGVVAPASLAGILDDASFWNGLGAADAARLAQVAEKALSAMESDDVASRLLAGACALEFLALASRCAVAGGAAGGTWRLPSGVWSVDDAVRYVELNYAESFSLDWFVSRCAMNVSDFSRRFRERAGCPLFEFINRQRVKRACALLKSSGMPIIEIASAVGYNNLSFFNRYFLRIMGLSPRAYRSGSSR